MVRHALIVTCLGPFPSVALAHPLAEAALEMEPGQWRELPTENMAAVMDTTNGGVPEYGDSAAWDPNSDRFFAHGQGHEGGWGMFRVVTFDAETNRWDSLDTPPWYGGYPHGITHGYDHNAVHPDTGTYYVRLFSWPYVYSYNVASDSWGELPEIPNWGQSFCCGGMVHFPEMGALVLVASGEVVAFDYEQQTWSQLGSAVPMGGYHNFAEYSSSQGAVVFGGGPDGGGDPRQIHRLDADGSITPLANAPLNLGTTAAVVTADPVSGTFLVLGDGGELYGYDLASDTWGLQSDEAPLPVFDTLAAPIPDHGVVMFANWDTGLPGSVYLYKMSPFVPTPEDPTTGSSTDDGGSSSDGDDTAGGSSAGSGPSGGSTTAGSSTAGGDDDNPTATDASPGSDGGSGASDSDSGGCSVAPGRASASGVLLLLLAAGRRRRRT